MMLRLRQDAQCWICGDTIPKGTLVVYSLAKGARHQYCDPAWARQEKQRATERQADKPLRA